MISLTFLTEKQLKAAGRAARCGCEGKPCGCKNCGC